MSKFSVADIVNRVWGYANVLRDDGISNGDYVEQLTLLIFLKMNAERAESGKINKNEISEAWSMLTTLQGKELLEKYSNLIKLFGEKDGLLGTIFSQAQNKIQDASKLKKLISLINSEKWISSNVDVKGAIYEGILQKVQILRKKALDNTLLQEP